MTCANQMTLLLGVAIAAAMAMSADRVCAQAPTPNAAPNLYRMEDNWAKLPEGRKWGSAVGVEVDKSDGKSIWVFDRCGSSDCSNSMVPPIQKFDSSGKYVTGFGAGMFNSPHGLTVDREGNVWVTDETAKNGKGAVVVKFSPQGKVLMTLGQPGTSGTGQYMLDRPSNVAVAPNGDIYIADGHGGNTNDRIVRYSKDGRFITAWGRRGKAHGEFDTPHGVAFDSAGRVFVADRGNNRIQIFDPDGKFLAEWKQFGRPSSVAIDKNDMIYVADTQSNATNNPGFTPGIRIGSVRDGEVKVLIPEVSPEIGVPNDISVDDLGNIYGASTAKMNVRRLAKSAQGTHTYLTYGAAADRDGDGWWAQMAFDSIGKGEIAFEMGTVRQGVFWNTFFKRDDDHDARLNARSQSTYNMVLDLSAYNYRTIAASNVVGTDVDPRVRSYLSKASDEPVELKIRPLSISPEVAIEGDLVKSIRIDRKKLIRPRSGQLVNDEKQRIEKFRAGVIKVAQFSDEVASGQVVFQVRAQKPGCALIAFTIWDLNDNPLDHLILTTAVDNGDEKVDCAASGVGAAALKGGLATLLDPAIGVGSSGDRSLDIKAALHLFEFETPQGPNSFAILLDKTKYSPPQPGRPETERGVFEWRLIQPSLSKYIGDDVGLPFQIGKAWDAAIRERRDDAYAKAADELAETIFGAEPGRGAQQAAGARAALQRIAETETNPIVLARLIGVKNEKLYVPLGLIAANGNKAGLSKPITVVQPMEQEHYSSGGRCIKDWAFGISGEMRDGKLEAELVAINSSPAREGERWLGTTDALSLYLNENADPRPAVSPGEGFVLLAHHDGVGVYYNQEVDRLKVEKFKRQYPPGSVGLLASCATSNPKDDMTLLKTLNRNGMDAMIVSPFKVPVEYGARLAIEFATLVRSSRQNRATPTIAELFSNASSSAAKYFRDHGDKKMQDMVLEFILVGDPYLRLCDQ